MSVSNSVKLYLMIGELETAAKELASRYEALKTENSQLKETNTRLMKEIALLTEVIRNMSKPEPASPVPGLPTFPISPFPQPTTQWYGNCPTCGLKLDTVMGYVCTNADCPTGLGGSKC